MKQVVRQDIQMESIALTIILLVITHFVLTLIMCVTVITTAVTKAMNRLAYVPVSIVQKKTLDSVAKMVFAFNLIMFVMDTMIAQMDLVETIF